MQQLSERGESRQERVSNRAKNRLWMRIPAILILSVSAISVFGQEIDIPLHDIEMPVVGARYISVPKRHDPDRQFAEFSVMGGTFSILSKVIGDTMLYRVSSNDGMTAEFSFAKDSVRQWAGAPILRLARRKIQTR